MLTPTLRPLGQLPGVLGATLAALLLLSGSGCRGRAAFSRGEELLRQGRDREAYYEFWEAYAQSRSPRYFAALRRTGRRVAETESQEVERLEAEGRLEEALERVTLALEYAPHLASLGSDYTRLTRGLLGWAELERRLAECRALGSEPDTELALLRRLAAHAGRPPGWESDWVGAVDRVVNTWLAPLRRRTFERPLPTDGTELARLGDGWAGVAGRLRGLAREGVPDSDARGASEAVRLATLLDSALAEARRGLEVCRGAEHGLTLLAEAESLARRGELAPACRLYARAVVVHDSLDVARARRAKAWRRYCEDRYAAAQEAMRSGAWEDAVRLWGELLDFAGDFRDAADLAEEARSRQVDVLARSARRYQRAGLYGNALVRYYLVLESEPGHADARRMVEELERVLEARSRPRLRIAPAVGDAAFGGELRVDAADLRGFEQRVRRRAGATLGRAEVADPAVDGSPGHDKWLLHLERFDFRVPAPRRSAAYERGSFVKRFRMTQNPSYRNARKELKQARKDLATRLSASWRAGEDKFSKELETLARWRLKGAEVKVSALAPHIAALAWEDAFYAVEQVAAATQVTARYRLGAETHEVTCEHRVLDRVVAGDVLRSVPPDPFESPSSRQVLRILAERLGDVLIADARRRLEEAQDRLLLDARKRLDDGSQDLAVESVVAYLLGRRGTPGDRLEDAFQLLREMTGCDLQRRWSGPI